MRQAGKGREAGVSLSGLIVVLAVLGAVALVAMRVFPAWAEYRSIKQAIAAAKAAGGSNLEMQKAFERNAEINNITVIGSKDLVITRDNGQAEISFAYEKRIALAGNVSLLIDYAGTTDPSGEVAAQADKAAK